MMCTAVVFFVIVILKVKQMLYFVSAPDVTSCPTCSVLNWCVMYPSLGKTEALCFFSGGLRRWERHTSSVDTHVDYNRTAGSELRWNANKMASITVAALCFLKSFSVLSCMWPEWENKPWNFWDLTRGRRNKKEKEFTQTFQTELERIDSEALTDQQTYLCPLFSSSGNSVWVEGRYCDLSK